MQSRPDAGLPFPQHLGSSRRTAISQTAELRTLGAVAEFVLEHIRNEDRFRRHDIDAEDHRRAHNELMESLARQLADFERGRDVSTQAELLLVKCRLHQAEFAHG